MERRMIALTESISKSFEFLAPTRIIFGAGSIHTLPEEIKNLDGNNAGDFSFEFMRDSTSRIEYTKKQTILPSD